MKVKASAGFFEVYKDFARYGEGIMLCHYSGRALNYVMFTSGQRKVVIDKQLHDEFKKNQAVQLTTTGAQDNGSFSDQSPNQA